MNKNSFLIELSESKRTEFGRVAFDQQDDVQRVFSAIWQLEGDVNNDGFHGYFLSNDSDIVAYAPTALRAIGADSCAGIVERAIQTIALQSESWDRRRAALAASGNDVQDRLHALDSEFYVYPDNLTELLFDFVSKHPEAFGPVSGEKGA